MTRPDAIRLGPFVGGLNTASDPTALDDTELVECINMELDIDGSLVSRPPIKETASLGGTWTERIKIIGRGSFPEGNYLIGSNANGTYAFDGTTWTVVRNLLHSEIALQYFGFMWVIPKPGIAASGGRWTPSGGFVVDTNMPQGESAVFHKGRLFVVPGISATVNESRLRFTDPIVSSTLAWTSTNIIDVAAGDGQNLVDLAIYNDNILLFKTDSTYVLAYDIRPADAILRNINTALGVTTKRCIVTYENSIFTFHEGNVYEVVNYDFTRLNVKVPFQFDGAAPGARLEEVFLSIVGDRLVCRYFNRIYVFGLKTRTWSRWDSKDDVLRNIGPLMALPTSAAQAVNTKYYAGSTIQEFENVCFMQNGFDTITEESTSSSNFDIECYIKTKNYDLADSHHFKRLMWWGADLLTTRNIEAAANPVVVNFSVTWDQLKQKTWDELNIWDSPVGTPLTVITDIENSTQVGRLFTKFLKGLRFRQINFEITLKNSGTTVQGPARVFTLTAIVAGKQTVSKKVS